VYNRKADTDAVIDAYGKNEQAKKVFWTLYVMITGLVLAWVEDPVTAQQIVREPVSVGCLVIAGT
jgi:hypothetical protein